MASGRIVVVGSGGHAKVVVSTIEASGGQVVGVLDADRARWGTKVLGHVVSGPVAADAVPRDAMVVLAIGANRIRQELSAQLAVRYAVVVHPSAVIHPSAQLGDGTVVFAGAIIQPDAIVGRHCIVNTAASVDHDGRIGSFVHLAPGVHLAGGVTVGDGTLIGVGSAVIPNRTIGQWAVVGAGATVIRDIPDRVIAAGCPARIIKE